ncbi:MAG: ribonuclease H-like YkuK family protein [Niabella sp.]
MKQKQWYTIGGNHIGISLKDAVKQALVAEQMQGHNICLCIGTDSQVKGAVTVFATAIVFVRKQNGAFLFVNKELITQKYSIKQRMMQEVARSIETAYDLKDTLREMNIEMEIHVDINSHKAFKSNEALQDAVGYITGMGFKYKIKPDAFASSSCANKVVQ